MSYYVKAKNAAEARRAFADRDTRIVTLPWTELDQTVTLPAGWEQVTDSTEGFAKWVRIGAAAGR